MIVCYAQKMELSDKWEILSLILIPFKCDIRTCCIGFYIAVPHRLLLKTWAILFCNYNQQSVGRSVSQCFSSEKNLALALQLLIFSYQVKYEGDPEAALITYSSNQEALSCYKCSDPVFNNRFIKVFWHQKNKDKTSQVRRKLDLECVMFVLHKTTQGHGKSTLISKLI